MNVARSLGVASMGLVLLALSGRSADAQRRAVVGGERVGIPSGDVVLGAREDALRAAIDLCRRESRFDGGASCTLERFAGELRTRIAHVGAFAIDRYEVTRERHRACVLAGSCRPSRDPESEAGERLPVVGIDLAGAEAFCAHAGGRLPSEEEWTRAARGDDERIFPWGNSLDVSRGNHGRPPLIEDPSDGFVGVAPAGSFPGGASPFGVHDLAGNVWEWTSSPPSDDDLALLGGPATASAYRVLRGGSFLHPAYAMRVTARNFLAPVDLRTADLGMRCVYDLP